MENKGFEVEQTMSKTPDTLDVLKKPLNSKDDKPPRVDINILKSKLLKSEEKQFRKNMATFLSFVVGLGALGIYLSI